MVGDQWNSEIIVNLLVTNVLGCVNRNVTTLVGVGSRSPVRARIFRHRKNELLIYQNPLSHGQFTSVKERAWHAQALGCPLPGVIYACRLAQSWISCVSMGTPQITICVDPLDWLPKEL